jgi:hypothetical protein
MTDIFEYIGFVGNIKPFDKRIPKTQLFLQGELSKMERDLLTERVEEVRLRYVLNGFTCPMEMVISDEEQYDTIFFVEVSLRREVSVQRLSKIIQETLPSPIILVFKLEDKVLFSSATKRLNQNDVSKVVVEEYYFSTWIRLSAPTDTQQHFLKAVSFDSIPKLDYKQAYTYIHQKIYKECNFEIVGNIKTDNFTELKKQTEKQKVIQMEIVRLSTLLDQKSTSLKEKVKLAKQIKALKL